MTSAVDLAPFDVCGPLPSGTTVLEASAGTGKTYTIAALATRYVAEGVAELPELMLVTFSRAATQELRQRVRERLVTAERGLADPREARLDGADQLLALLADAPDDEVARRRHRLTRALAAFDAATIATTHGFCLQMLAGLGMAGDLEPDATFVEDVDDLVVEVVGDLYLRRFAGESEEAAVDPRTALAVARAAIGDPQATLVAADPPDGSSAQLRHALATDTYREVFRRKRMRRLLDYDDLVSRLDDALRDSVRGAAAVERVRSRYRVVLVDEFQDTDPLQWRILETAFHGATTLVLIGDPEAGDLRLPRRRPGHVSRRDRRGVGAPHAGPQLAQRRAAADRAWGGVSWRGAGRRADPGARRRRVARRAPARRRRSPAAAAGGTACVGRRV